MFVFRDLRHEKYYCNFDKALKKKQARASTEQQQSLKTESITTRYQNGL
jgi:hypothetical protein